MNMGTGTTTANISIRMRIGRRLTAIGIATNR